MMNVNLVKSPIVSGCRLSKEGDGVEVDSTTYKQMVGSLMYLTVTRPDIMFDVSLVSKYMEIPTRMHQQAVKKILRYIQGTVNLEIFYSSEGELELISYNDSDYARDMNDRKNTYGHVFLLGT